MTLPSTTTELLLIITYILYLFNLLLPYILLKALAGKWKLPFLMDSLVLILNFMSMLFLQNLKKLAFQDDIANYLALIVFFVMIFHYLLYCKFYLKTQLYQGFLLVFILCFLGIVSEAVVILVVYQDIIPLKEIFSKDSALNPYMFINLMTTTVYLSIYVILRKFRGIPKHLNKVASYIKYPITVMPFLFVLLYFLIYTRQSEAAFDGKRQLYFYVMLLLLFGMLVFSYIYSRIRKHHINMKIQIMEYKMLNDYTTLADEAYQEMRALKHDYTNILLGLAGYIEQEDWQGMSQYYEKFMKFKNGVAKVT